jgi:hypothetical protein
MGLMGLSHNYCLKDENVDMKIILISPRLRYIGCECEINYKFCSFWGSRKREKPSKREKARFRFGHGSDYESAFELDVQDDVEDFQT